MGAADGLGVACEFIEAGESAKTADRPKLLELLTYCLGRNRRGVLTPAIAGEACGDRACRRRNGGR
jgi:hypothetical protein